MEATSAAERMLMKADRILAAVDEAYIITHRNHKPRLMPAFRPEEISLGKVLGLGGTYFQFYPVMTFVHVEPLLTDEILYLVCFTVLQASPSSMKLLNLR